ncbi:TetR/AcrR family transcriptional regulator [Undibacterium sp. RTI2.1]|uniref:TetR/AcrR family transcriptional regulator n=1 Tax=unclassified Undibacterium TaxID=2630295 RepID=UPI002AB39B82|nr:MULTISPECIES: TetR/AcrR family transcriptional regulator [unclassified Undibacterium]MDY7538302.1 TetR/AcrR family transcriptional regulator [Undibacterium sp. 5I1]MEB0031512.1 TetR/AcrR family transcriptional regulator [Undibacterium sp. RTI2.1]MEB0115074.1 TetR/AcrR family transcriptional regulator [Undibacterium sp. RTI2.2]MEB0229423.1 TetR/AcrR family transcriptional regulator [Undibacterium sp. 10I3]MEB0256033.1 TetR/AcrR family transcriptional regulator [Undibacterium sp. 5I1]
MSTENAKSYHHKDLRRSLIDQALTTLTAGGSQAISLRNLAREIGVSHSAPLRHFPTREALLAELAVFGFEQLTEAMEVAKKKPNSKNMGDALKNVGIAYVRFAIQQPHLFRLMFTADRVDSTRYEQLRQAGDQCKAVMVDLVVLAVGSGDLVASSTEMLALSCWAMVHGLASLAIDQQVDISNEQAIVMVTSQLLHHLENGIAAKL